MTAQYSSLGGNHNTDDRLELLLFHLVNGHPFGINVLKVKEIIACPTLSQLPQSGPAVRGVVELRGSTLPVIDLGLAIGLPRLDLEDETTREQAKIIIAEFNRTTQGFLIAAVDHILVRHWHDVLPPPHGVQNGYITGVIQADQRLVQLVDVERVLAECMAISTADAPPPAGQIGPDAALVDYMKNRVILVVDDSSIARTQTERTLEQLGFSYIMAPDGREALEILQELLTQFPTITDRVPLVISDIEMPELDGYQLTRRLKNTPGLEGIYVLLHTSLDAKMNGEKARQAGADQSLTKFVPELLQEEVTRGLLQQIRPAE